MIKKQIIESILKSRNILITGHVNPDGDSIGSQLCLSLMLKARKIPHRIINYGEIPEKYQFLPGCNSIIKPEGFDGQSEIFDTAVFFECSNLERAGGVAQLIGEDCRVINIDHHIDNDRFGDLNWTDPKASAVGVMVYEMFRENSIEIDKDMATNLYAAILTDTGRFHFNNTTPRCLRTAADLVEIGADPVGITDKVYFNHSRQKLLLTGLALSTIRYLLNGRLCYLTVDLNIMEKASARKSDTEGLINKTLNASGVEIGVLFTEVDNSSTKVSFRSQTSIDVEAIASHFGGGGHINASGAVIELPLKRATETVLDYVKGRMNGSA